MLHMSLFLDVKGLSGWTAIEICTLMAFGNIQIYNKGGPLNR